MNVAVVGLGSIGRRHASNLARLPGIRVVAVRSSLQGNDLGLKEVGHLRDAGADVAIVCTPTARHAQDLAEVAELALPVLCEKPLVSDPVAASSMAKLFRGYPAVARVAFNMRFHPTVLRVRQWLADERVGPLRYARFSVGQYLPDWRPGTNHLEGYGARSELGGGVALDLVHELDLAEWLCGPRVGPLSGVAARVGEVTVDTEDTADFVYRAESGAVVSVHMDYLYRGYRRTFELVGRDGTIVADLGRGRADLLDERGETRESEALEGFERNRMYELVLADFLGQIRGSNPAPTLPTFMESMSTLESIFQLKAGCVRFDASRSG